MGVQSNRNKKFCLPKEFELLPEVKDFLKRHVPSHSSKKQTRSSRKQLSSSNTKMHSKQMHKDKGNGHTLDSTKSGDQTLKNGKYDDHKKTQQNGKYSKSKPEKSGKVNRKKSVPKKQVS